MLKTSDFDYELPLECIAQEPVEPRDHSRLMVIHRNSEVIQHTRFNNLEEYLNPGDLFVINSTRVIPARLYARKIPSGGKIEILLLRKIDSISWEALVGGKGMLPGKSIQIENGMKAVIQSDLGGARRLIKFEQPIDTQLDKIGRVPLPPYIRKPITDPDRYQTVFARQPGSAAAPTAGLHFTPELIGHLKDGGYSFVEILLHIGLDTFAPVTVVDPRQHPIHTEWFQLSEDAAKEINRAHREGRRIIAVGTTSVRALESAARWAKNQDIVGNYEGSTDLKILPGYKFKVVDAMITNFHLPRSTLVMLVSAFSSREQILNSYKLAINLGYRFFSFGDAMLIL